VLGVNGATGGLPTPSLSGIAPHLSGCALSAGQCLVAQALLVQPYSLFLGIAAIPVMGKRQVVAAIS